MPGAWPAPSAPPESASGGRKAVIFVIDQVTWRDVAETPTPSIDTLIKRGGIASMNCWTAPPVTREKAYLSIGAGNRAQALHGKPAESYNVPPGVGPQPERPLPRYALPGQVVNAWAAELERDNAGLRYDVHVGTLGDALHRAGLKTAVVGNADHGDVPLRPGREAVSIAMDSRGVADLGDVGFDVLQQRPESAIPVQTDVAALAWRLTQCLTQADLIVVESGDTVRAAFSAVDPAHADPYERDRKLRALERADYCLGEILPGLDRQWLLIVVSPSPSPGEFQWLTPVIICGPRYSPGYLISDTTHRAGLVAAMDIAPTVLSYFGLPVPPAVAGRPARPADMAGAPAEVSARVRQLVDAETRVHNANRARRILFPAHVAGVWCAALLAILYARCKGPSAWPRLRGPLAALQLVIIAVPIGCYLVHFAPPGLTELQMVGAAMGSAVVLAAVAVFSRWEHLGPVGQLCWLQILIILADVWLFDARLQLGSMYGYSPIAGARFYGLGNEALSLLLGASIIAFATTPALRRELRWPTVMLPALCALAVTAAVGHPQLGANTGGTITAVVAYGTWLLLLARPRRPAVAVGLIAAAVVAVLGAFVLADLLQRGGAETHMGHATRQVLSGGAAAAWCIIARKLSTSVSLLLYTPWCAVLVAWVVFLLYSAFRPPAALRRVWDAYPPMRTAARTLAVGAIVGSLVNDTGICVAALMLSYAMFAMTFAAVTGAADGRRQRESEGG